MVLDPVSGSAPGGAMLQAGLDTWRATRGGLPRLTRRRT